MTNTDIVNKLIGNINPIGKTEIDKERLKNLKEMCELVNDLVTQIDTVSYNCKDRQEHSMKIAGEYAHNFLTNILGIKE